MAIQGNQAVTETLAFLDTPSELWLALLISQLDLFSTQGEDEGAQVWPDRSGKMPAMVGQEGVEAAAGRVTFATTLRSEEMVDRAAQEVTAARVVLVAGEGEVVQEDKFLSSLMQLLLVLFPLSRSIILAVHLAAAATRDWAAKLAGAEKEVFLVKAEPVIF
jgi:hypothetical protein